VLGSGKTFFSGSALETFTIAEASTVPVPAALPLFASALIGGGVIARRKRHKQKAEPLAA